MMAFSLLIENFDVVAYLDDKGIEYHTHGKNVSYGWIEVNCPWCDDPSFHLGISPQKRLNCWRCGPHGSVINYIKVIEKCSTKEARRILAKYQQFGAIIPLEEIAEEEGEQDKQVVIPKSAVTPLPEMHKEYLLSRGFNPDYLTRKYLLRGCGPVGKYKFRIIIPVFVENRLVTFTSRDVTGRTEIRYKNYPNDLSIIPVKESIYNIDSVKPGGRMIIVEGPFDVWRIGDGAVATFGTNFTDEQVKLIINKKPSSVAIMYDPEPEALEKAEELAYKLSPFVDKVEIVEIDAEDPASLTEKEVRKIRRIFLDDLFHL